MDTINLSDFKNLITEAEHIVLTSDLQGSQSKELECLRKSIQYMKHSYELLMSALGLLLQASVETQKAEFYVEIVHWLSKLTLHQEEMFKKEERVE
jgi:hypothetical protein